MDQNWKNFLKTLKILIFAENLRIIDEFFNIREK